jgi:hypothetical protein
MIDISVFNRNWQGEMMKFSEKIAEEENGKLKLLLYFFF